MRTKQLVKYNNNVQVIYRENTLSTAGDEFIIDEIWKKEVYSKHLLADSHIIIDIGAHIGIFSLLAAVICPKAKIYCYEPEPNNYELLVRNVEQNNLSDRLNLYQLGIAESSGERILNIANINTGGSSIIWGKDRTKKIAVNCTTLEKILEENHIDEVDFVKIDCEGAEFGILYSSETSLKQINTISMEIHECKNCSQAKLIKYLEDNNFRIEETPVPGHLRHIDAYK